MFERPHDEDQTGEPRSTARTIAADPQNSRVARTQKTTGATTETTAGRATIRARLENSPLCAATQGAWSSCLFAQLTDCLPLPGQSK